MTVIIALDPGKTTGVAVWNDGEFEALELNFDQTCTYVEKMAERYGDELKMVSESFIITQHTAKNTQATWSLELIGVFRFLQRKWVSEDPLRLQMPSAAKRFSSDNRLRQMGFWTRGKGHANDASRHLLLYMATNGFIPQQKLAELAS